MHVTKQIYREQHQNILEQIRLEIETYCNMIIIVQYCIIGPHFFYF